MNGVVDHEAERTARAGVRNFPSSKSMIIGCEYDNTSLLHVNLYIQEISTMMRISISHDLKTLWPENIYRLFYARFYQILDVSNIRSPMKHFLTTIYPFLINRCLESDMQYYCIFFDYYNNDSRLTKGYQARREHPLNTSNALLRPGSYQGC